MINLPNESKYLSLLSGNDAGGLHLNASPKVLKILGFKYRIDSIGKHTTNILYGRFPIDERAI